MVPNAAALRLPFGARKLVRLNRLKKSARSDGGVGHGPAGGVDDTPDESGCFELRERRQREGEKENRCERC